MRARCWSAGRSAVPGVGQGRLVGGNLSLIAADVGVEPPPEVSVDRGVRGHRRGRLPDRPDAHPAAALPLVRPGDRRGGGGVQPGRRGLARLVGSGGGGDRRPAGRAADPGAHRRRRRPRLPQPGPAARRRRHPGVPARPALRAPSPSPDRTRLLERNPHLAWMAVQKSAVRGGDQAAGVSAARAAGSGAEWTTTREVTARVRQT